MNLSVNPRILPYATHFAGVAGFFLHIWLRLSGVDEKGLYLKSHPAQSLMFLLTAAVLLLLYLAVRRLREQSKYSRLFPASFFSGVGSAVAAAGIVWSSLRDVLAGADLIAVFALAAGIAACVSLLFTGYCRIKGAQPNFRFYGIITVFMILRAVNVCRSWNIKTQLITYFFPLLASLFLVLCTYYHTVLAYKKGDSRKFVFTNQAALFFCWLAAPADPVFYFAMCIYLGLDLPALQGGKRYAPRFLKEND